MRKINLVFTTLLVLLFLSSFAKAQTEKLDNLAACAGVVIGNGAVDFYLGDEQSFDVAANIAYSAYLSEVFSAGHQQNDLQVADQILGANVDKIINAHNSENFTADVYEEVVGCYRALAKQLMEGAETIINNQSKWNELKNTSIETLKRTLSAGHIDVYLENSIHIFPRTRGYFFLLNLNLSCRAEYLFRTEETILFFQRVPPSVVKPFSFRSLAILLQPNPSI